MQFIATGDRIAVENFTVGYLYTITFTNGDYIHTACTGIGIDFVMFSRTPPDYTFALTMDTADTVSTIDIYSGGGGTVDYNDLTNKPQINNVVLAGNKTLNDLGIQPVITDDNKLSYTLISGLGTAATTSTSDYATAAQGALADTAVQPTALNDYQTLIDNDNKLSADLVDDTSTTNKFATSAQLDQIETNKNNISSLWDSTSKNHYKITATQSTTGITYTKISESELSISGTYTGSTYVYFNLTGNNFKLPACTWKFRFTTTGTVPNRNITFGIQGQGNTTASKDTDYEFTTTGEEYLSAYIQFLTNDTVDGSIRIMVRPANATDTTYQPYAPTNRELYEMILAMQ